LRRGGSRYAHALRRREVIVIEIRIVDPELGLIWMPVTGAGLRRRLVERLDATSVLPVERRCAPPVSLTERRFAIAFLLCGGSCDEPQREKARERCDEEHFHGESDR
jgi:hypothetical protein